MLGETSTRLEDVLKATNEFVAKHFSTVSSSNKNSDVQLGDYAGSGAAQLGRNLGPDPPAGASPYLFRAQDCGLDLGDEQRTSLDYAQCLSRHKMGDLQSASR